MLLENKMFHLLGKEKHPAFSNTAEKSSDLSLLLIWKVNNTTLDYKTNKTGCCEQLQYALPNAGTQLVMCL